MMQVDMQPSFKGRVKIEKGTVKDGITETIEFDNVFLVSGIKDISRRIVHNTGGDDESSLRLYLGTGTTEPTMYDTGLEARDVNLAGKLYLTNSVGSSPDTDRIHQPVGTDKKVIAAYDFTYRYGEGEAQGVWTELGLGNGNYSVAHTRALIRNEEGQPISLTVLSDEYLVVYYHLEIATQPLYDLGVHTLNGTDHRVYFFNRRGSHYYRYSTNYRGHPTCFGWGDGSHTDGGRIYGIYRYPNPGTVDMENGNYSGFTYSTGQDSEGNYIMSGLTRELDLDSFGYKWSVFEGPFLKDVQIAHLWVDNGDTGVLHFDPPLVIPENHRIHINFHARVMPENYDKSKDPLYDPDFDPDLQGGA